MGLDQRGSEMADTRGGHTERVNGLLPLAVSE